MLILLEKALLSVETSHPAEALTIRSPLAGTRPTPVSVYDWLAEFDTFVFGAFAQNPVKVAVDTVRAPGISLSVMVIF